MMRIAIGFLALTLLAASAPAQASDGNHGNFHGGFVGHSPHFTGGHNAFFLHHHRFFRHVAVIDVFGWPFSYYPYWIDDVGYLYGLPPGQVQLGDPIPGQEYCREFQTTMLFQGQAVPAYGIACQQADGSWRAIY